MDNTKVSMDELAPLMRECIENGGSFRLTVTGGSMVPTFWPGRDSVVLKKTEKIKNHDVIFYLRDNGTYVLHRIIGIKKGGFALCGDNQHVAEYPIRPDQVMATVIGFYRNGKYIDTSNLIYRFLVFIWCISIKARPLMSKIYLKIRTGFSGKK